MAKQVVFEKDYLIRSLITLICRERIFPELKYQPFFWGTYARLINRLRRA